jgi:hypothetical protein
VLLILLLDYFSFFNSSQFLGTKQFFREHFTILIFLQVDVIAPAVTGTQNVLKACYEAKVKRVVVVSSVAAVFNNPNWPKGEAFTEDSWSDGEYCRKNEVS